MRYLNTLVHMTTGTASMAFLRLLDAVVAGDAAPSGLQGTLCVGVHLRDRIAWWEVDFSTGVRAFREEAVDASYDAAFPEAHDAAVLVGVRTAMAIAGEGPEVTSADPCVVAGRAALLTAFVGRYLKRQNQASLRTAFLGAP